MWTWSITGSAIRLEYDIVAAPGADTSKIKFAVEGDAKTVIDGDGDLQILTAAGMVVIAQAYRTISMMQMATARW